MKSISRTEFRDNLKKYFELAENECIIIHKGVKKAYILMPLCEMDETEFVKASPLNVSHMKRGIKEFNRGDYSKLTFKNRARVNITPTALLDLKCWRDKKDKRISALINRLILEICTNPNGGLGDPKPLKAEFAGFWSRSINTEHRIIYKIKDGEPIIICMRYQYEGEEE